MCGKKNVLLSIVHVNTIFFSTSPSCKGSLQLCALCVNRVHVSYSHAHGNMGFDTFWQTLSTIVRSCIV